MPHFPLLSPSEQVAVHLRGEFLRGVWKGTMPGAPLLAAELGVDPKTILAAFRLLEAQGFLIPQGPGRRRLIRLPEGLDSPVLRVAILLPEAGYRKQDYLIELVHQLTEAGHSVLYPARFMNELAMDVMRIARMVRTTAADAWVVAAGSRELLEWFAAEPIGAFALLGRRGGLPIAGVGPNKTPSCLAATRALIGLGHRRIVILDRPRRFLPEPGATERAILAELVAHGIPSGSYNLPIWEESNAGFHACLDSLFRVTPPTALIIGEAQLFAAAQQFLARRRILVPEDVSLVCSDADPSFAWCQPSIAHIRWDSGPVVRRVVRWAAKVSCGKDDRRQTFTKAEFVEGGTVGPVRMW